MKVGNWIMNREQLDYLVSIFKGHAHLNTPEDYSMCAGFIRTGLVCLWNNGTKLVPDLTHAGRVTLARHLDSESRANFGLSLAGAS